MTEKICAIVGMGDGMGLALARRFAREGFTLGLLARRFDQLMAYRHQLQTEGYSAQAFPADAAIPDSLMAAFDSLKEQLGQPNVLIYNVAHVAQGIPSQLAVPDVLSAFKVNTVGALIAAQQVIPAMQNAQTGTILFTGGGLALHPNPLYSSLAMGKAALRNLAFSLAGELKPQGIHVATVTIAGFIQPNTPFDPNTIAEEYWKLYTQTPDQWETEIVFKGA